jgi:amidase
LFAADLNLSTATIQDINTALSSGGISSEKLVGLYLKRIETYEPKLNAIITLNPDALAQARALDAERKAGKLRGPLHGIPVVLKDNFDTADLPTTGGFFGLKGSLPPRDATVVAQLRAAGAIILAKLNLSEFASGGASSSITGPAYNPHALDRSPAGSSGGTGVAIAAYYAPLGYGSDTGGSIRGPSTANGVVGLKPTLGLLSRAGIIPLALSFDTGGPMARSVYDIALSLNVTAARTADPRDPATAAAKTIADYTTALRPDALKGARIGVARDFFGQDSEVDSVMESAIATLRAQGATLVDVRYPASILKIRGDLYNAIRRPEFKAQIADYLATLKPGYPKNVADILALSEKVVSPSPGGPFPNHGRLNLYRQEVKAAPLSDPHYRAALEQGLPFIRSSIDAVFAADKLDAIIYPTNPRRPALIGEDAPSPLATGTPAAPVANSPTNFANLTGYPDLIVPAGFTVHGLPVGLSFFGPAWSEPKLLGYGYAFEQATKALRIPVHTPVLTGETITY